MDLYSVKDISTKEQTHFFTIFLDPGHEVYKGHFPKQPVTPGVLQLRIVRELLEKVVDRKLQLKFAQSLKFLSFMDPNRTEALKVSIHLLEASNDELKIKADITDEARIYFKMMASFGNARN